MIKYKQHNHDRRYFLKATAALGTGLKVGIYCPQLISADASAAELFKPNAFIRITPDNVVTVIIKHLEKGQGTYTGLATLAADEMDASWDQIVCEQAPADASRYNNLFFGPYQGTGGSTGLANSFQQMRTAGAAAKVMLIAAAVELWQVPEDEIRVEAGVVSHAKSAKSASFGDLAELASKQSLPENVQLKTADQFVYIGKTVSRKDIGKTNGTAIYTQDINLPGMLTALVAHPPRFGARIERFNADAAKFVQGVEHVLQIDTGVAVLAKDYWTAKKGRDALEIVWDEANAESLNSNEQMQHYRELASNSGKVARSDGDVVGAMDKCATVLQANYEFPYLAHATMEPMNCVVQITAEGVEIHNGAQLQTGDQFAVATQLGLNPEQVRINTLFAGSSFGRSHPSS